MNNDIQFIITSENDCTSTLELTRYEAQIQITHTVTLQCELGKHSPNTPHGATLNTTTQQVRIRWEDK